MEKLYSPFKTIPNFRDVGRFINEQLGEERMKTGVFFRGARPDDASSSDRRKLVEEYKLKSIIDLRTKTEHIAQAQKRDARIKSSEAALQTNQEAAEPLKIPGIRYHEINFNGHAFSFMLISKLSWYAFFKLITLMLFGYRDEAISLITPAMEEKGLEGLAVDSMDVCTAEVRQVFEVLSKSKNHPVMIHCTQGKDRTGLTVMLVLFLLGIPTEAIDADYMLTDLELVYDHDERVREIKKVGLSERFAKCAPGLVQRVEQHIFDKYGNIENYLQYCGVTDEMRDAVKSMFTANHETTST